MSRIKQIPLFIIAAILIGLKTYIVYRFYFNLSIETLFQELILVINAFAISLFIFSFAVWMNPKKQVKFIKYTSIILSAILYVNLVYYRNFTDFMTLPTIFQYKNIGDLGSSILSLIHLTDIFLLLDVVLVFIIAKKQYFITIEFSKIFKKRILAVALSFLALNLTLAEIERPMLFKRGFDREYLVKNVGVFTFHVYDAYLTATTQSKRLFADGSMMTEIEEYVDENIRENASGYDLKGIAEGKNIVYISFESLQNFVINEKINGEEITPFLNKLIKESYYFDNFYHQTNLGKTSDHEFLLDNSLYPLPNSAVFYTHAQNEYNALPEIIKREKNYNSYVFHANNATFWNRNQMYASLGYEHFFDKEYYEVNKSNEIGWGLNDKEFFKQSIELMKDLDQPFYAKFITLTNHFPFDLPEEEANIDKFNSNSVTLNQYFQTVRYADEAIEQFFEDMKRTGMYEDTIFIIMGDHYGISSYHNGALEQFLGKEITPYEDVKLQRVPLIIHIPGNEHNATISTLGGQIDYKPTVLNMLGIENKNDIIFGEDLFSKNRKDFIAFRDGRVVGEDYIYAAGICYDADTGEKVEGDYCEPMIEQSEQELNYSDEIIYGDLFRFYDFDNGEIIVEDE